MAPLKNKMSKAQPDGFQLVVSKRFHKNKQTKIPEKQFKFEDLDSAIDVERSKRKIQSAVEDLKLSAYFGGVTLSVSKVLQSLLVKEIVCFGLGHIGECKISQYQLGLLLCLKEELKPSRVLVHDPVFSKDECTILQELGLEIIPENTEGSYIISDLGITLFYLPHCPKQLTNNLLWSNWGLKLGNCILICNSFNSLFENQPDRLISETVGYIHKIKPYTKEKPLENNFRFNDIFNDTSVHYFPKEDLQKLSPEFWTSNLKPEYQDNEEFITSLMLEKLKIS